MSKEDDKSNGAKTSDWKGTHRAQSGRDADKSQGRQSGGAHSQKNQGKNGKH